MLKVVLGALTPGQMLIPGVFPVFQDYLLSHMYGNAARDDLWRKLSQVRL